MGVLESQELLALKFAGNHSTTLSPRLPSHQEEKLQEFSKIVKLDFPEIRNNDPLRPGGGKLCLILLFVLKV